MNQYGDRRAPDNISLVMNRAKNSHKNNTMYQCAPVAQDLYSVWLDTCNQVHLNFQLQHLDFLLLNLLKKC